MKIILYEPAGGGGIFHYTFELAESLSRKGIDVLLLTNYDHELGELRRHFRLAGRLGRSQLKGWLLGLLPTTVEGNRYDLKQDRVRTVGCAPSISVCAGGLRRLVLWIELLVTILTERPDVIHCQWLREPETDYYLLRFLKLIGYRVVYTAHNVIPHEAKKRDKELFRRIYQIVDRVIVHALDNKREMTNTLSMSERQISVVPHGAYQMFYEEKCCGKEHARNSLGLPQEKVILLFFGGIRPYKGLEYLVDAFRSIRGKIANLLLLIVGDVPGTKEAEESASYYAEYMAQLEKEEAISCRREYVAFGSVGSYFIASDIVVLPYIKTYQSGVLSLACAAGRPAIVTDTGGLAEVVEHGKTGLVVQPKDAQGLADAISTLVMDLDCAEAMGRRAKALANSIYSWDAVAQKTAEIYESLLQNNTIPQFTDHRRSPIE